MVGSITPATPRGRFGRRRALGFAALGGSAAFLAACGGKSEDSGGASAPRATISGVQQANQAVATAAATEKVKPGGAAAVRIATTAPLDPIANTTYTAQYLASMSYSRLLKFKTDAKATTADNYESIPDLASGFEAATDGTQYTFKLKPAKFHAKAPINGRQVEAEDVRVTLERFKTDPKNTNRNTFNLVDKVETPDAQTVVFKLKQPFGPFVSLISTAQYLWIMPKELGSNAFDPAKDQIGTGPFMYESLQPDVEIKYKKNQNYFVNERPYIDEFKWVVLTDSTQEVSQFQAKRLDLAEIPYEQVKDVQKSNPDANILKFDGSTLPFIAPQWRGTSVFKDERIRRAMSHATDRDSLVQLSFGGEGFWQSMVPSSFGRWRVDPKTDSSPGAKYFKFDIKESVALMKAAGYDESKPLKFKFIFTPNGYTQRFNQYAEAVAGMLKETKVFDPQIVTADYQGEYIKSGGIFFGAYEGVFFGLQSGFNDPDDYLFNPMHSKSTRNHVGVEDPQLDAMIDKERATINVEERVKAVQEIQRYVFDKMYYVTTFYGPLYQFLQPWLRGYYSNRGYGLGAERFLDMWLNK